LSSHKILSAPVVDWKAQRLLGFVDMLDLVSFVLSLYNADIHQTPLDSNLLFEKSNQFFSKPIKEIIDLSKRNPLCQVLKTSPLWECISLFQRGLHRVVVTNEERKIVGILSQSDVVRFLAGKMDEHYSFFGKTVEELNLGTYSLITVRDTQPTIAALKILYEHKVSAVAVVNKEGILVGNLSASDLKGATIVTDSDQGADPFGSLFLPVITFLKQGGMTKFPVGTCTRNTAFNFVLLRILALRVHRLWIVDEKEHPIGVISLTDIMKALIAEKQPERRT
jgi:CBS domain-containing protein